MNCSTSTNNLQPTNIITEYDDTTRETLYTIHPALLYFSSSRECWDGLFKDSTTAVEYDEWKWNVHYVYSYFLVTQQEIKGGWKEIQLCNFILIPAFFYNIVWNPRKFIDFFVSILKRSLRFDKVFESSQFRSILYSCLHRLNVRLL